jgi:DnaK suppressor protein
MDLEAARSQLEAERTRLRQRLAEVGESEAQGRRTGSEPGDEADTAQPVVTQVVGDAVTATLRNRLGAVERALRRVDEGTYGRSVRSGEPIPEARLEADPAAELTVEEASRDQDRKR